MNTQEDFTAQIVLQVQQVIQNNVNIVVKNYYLCIISNKNTICCEFERNEIMSKIYNEAIMIKSNPTGGIYDFNLVTFTGTKKHEVMKKVKEKTKELEEENILYNIIETVD